MSQYRELSALEKQSHWQWVFRLFISDIVSVNLEVLFHIFLSAIRALSLWDGIRLAVD
jgi:hypothetical protein